MSLRERKKAETLAAIREAAARLFAEKGYEATRTRDIAEAAGIATGTLFNYAPTKRDVVILVWKERAERASDAGFEAAGRAAEPIEGIVALFDPIFAFYAEDLALGRIFLEAAVYGEGHDLVAFNTVFISRIAALLAPRAGASASTAAINVFGAYYMVLTMMLTGQIGGPAAAGSLLRGLVQAQAAGWD